MVELSEMGISRISSAEGGWMARSPCDRSAVEEDRPFTSEAAQTTQGRPSVDREPACAGRDSVDSAERGSLARLAEKFPHPSTCWRRLRDWEERDVLVEHLAGVSERIEPAPAIEWSESFLDGSFAPAKKGATGSEKPSGARGRSGWWWSTAAVFLWETTFTLHPRGSQTRGNRRSRRFDRAESSRGSSSAEAGAGDRRQSL